MIQGQLYFCIFWEILKNWPLPVSSWPSYFSEINQEHFIASYTNETKYVKKWKTEKEAQDFLNEWTGTGIGLNGIVMMICDFGYENQL